MSNELNIYQRINKIMSEVSYLKKNATVGYNNNSYTAITHDHVTQAIHDSFVKHGVVTVPSMINSSISKYEVKTKKGVSQRYETQATARVKFVNMDNPSDWFEAEAFAHSFDTQDKSCGKAYSMAVKYCYLKVLMIASGDDEEVRIQEDNGTVTQSNANSYAKEMVELKRKVATRIQEKGIDVNAVKDKLSKMKQYNLKKVIELCDRDGTALIDYITEFKGE